MKDTTVTPNDVVRAALRIRPFIRRTPTIVSKYNQIALKLESHQHTGAYKVRGALNALMVQLEQGDTRTIIAASAGNHSAGVAWAASKLDLKAVTVVPRSAPKSKIEKTRALGAQVIVHGEYFDESFEFAQKMARTKNWRFLHAFDDPDVIAGQGTIGFELLPYRPSTVIVPVGGGGLISGISRLLHQHDIRVIGAQVTGVDAMRRGLENTLRGFEPSSTIADGIRVKRPGRLTQGLCAQYVDSFVNVTENEVRSAIADLYHDEGIAVEGAGAVAFAAARKLRLPNTCAIVSGQNIDQKVLDAIVAERPKLLRPAHFEAATQAYANQQVIASRQMRAAHLRRVST